MSGFGGAVKLTGESEYRNALKKITQNLKEVSSEMKLATSSFEKNDKSVQALTAKQNGLNQKLEQQKAKLATVKTAYADMSKQYQDNQQKHNALVQTYEKEKAELDRIGKELGEDSKEYQEQKKVVDALSKEVDKSTKAQDANEKSLSNMRIEMNKSQADINKTERELDKLDKELQEAVRNEKNASAETGKLGRGFGTLKGQTGQANQGFTVLKGTLANLASEGIQKVIGGLRNLGTNAISAWKDFDAGVDIIIAKTGATGKSAEEMEQTFKNLSTEVVASQQDIGTAVGEVNTRFGVTGGELNDLSARFLKFAKLNNTDVNTSIDSVQSAMSAWGIEAKDTGLMLDTLNSAGQQTGVSVNKLSELMKTNAPALKEMGFSASDSALFLANLDKSGVDVSQTMVAMRKALATASKEGKPMDQAMQEMEESIRNAGSSTEAITKATELFGSRAGPSIAVAVRDGRLSFKELGTSMKDYEGSVNQTFENTIDAPERFAMTIQNIKSQFGDVVDNIMERYEPQIESALETMTSVATKFFSGLEKGIDFFMKNADGIITALGMMATGIGAYLAYTTALKVMTSGWMALGIVQKAVTAGQWALNTAMSANPIGLVIAGVTALVAGFIILWKRSEKFRKFWKGLWKEIKRVAEPIIKGVVEAFKKAFDFILAVWKKAPAFFKGIWNGIKAVFNGVVTYYKTIFTLAINAVKAVWNGIKAYFLTVVNAIKTAFNGIEGWFRSKFLAVVSNIKAGFSSIGAFFKGIYSKITGAFSGVTTYFKTKFDKAVGNIKSAFSGIPKYISTIWGKVKNTFSGLGGKLGSAIGGGVKSGINSAIRLVEGAMNKAIGYINGAINIINKIPKVNVPKIKKLSLPRLATGGVLERGQVGLLEGSGAEAVVPLEKNTKWIKKVADSMRTTLGISKSSTSASQEMQYYDAVSAFKTALSEMKIVLDDEVAGEFVEKTVTRIIYT